MVSKDPAGLIYSCLLLSMSIKDQACIPRWSFLLLIWMAPLISCLLCFFSGHAFETILSSIKKYFDNNIKPSNLILIYSNSKLNKPMDKLPKYFDKTFNNVIKLSYKDYEVVLNNALLGIFTKK